MVDDQWPVATPRDEVLARVAARGTRIRAVRGALNALAVLTVVGVSTLGVGAAFQAVTDGSAPTEVDNVAMGPEPPDVSRSAVTSADADDTTSTTGRPGSNPVPDRDDDVPTGSAGGGPGSGTVATVPSSPGSGSTPGSAVVTTTSPTTSAVEPETTTSATPSTTEPPAPAVSNLRLKTDGVPTGLNVCADEADSVVAVEISGAETAVMSWSWAGEVESVSMSTTGTTTDPATDADWQAPLGELEDQGIDVPVIVTIEATGPGGTTSTSVTVDVADCSPLPSVPPETGA